jgi:hypothetical protein
MPMIDKGFRGSGLSPDRRAGRRRPSVRASVLGPCLAVGLLAAGVIEAATPSLQPHRAIYRLSLAKGVAGSEISGASGDMFYRFHQDCEGWAVENRTVLQLSYATGGDAESVWTFASWEAMDGREYRFYARHEQNGSVVERLEGRARIEAGGEGAAEFTRPPGKTIALPPGTLFPTEHVRMLVESAGRGERSLTRVVFDGASLDNPYLVHAVIGPLREAEAAALAKATGLPPAPSWSTHMAFFPLGRQNSVPEFEIGAHYRDDGIADRIVQRFDTFSLDVKLTEFEALTRPRC